MSETCITTKSPYAAIAFDLDGTLVDTVPDLLICANLTMQALNRPQVSIDEVRLWIGNGIETIVQRTLSGDYVVDSTLDPALVADAVALFKGFYLEHIDDQSVLYPNVRETLEKLHRQGIPLAVVTNKARQFTMLLLKALAIDHTFDIIICGDDLDEKKPHPMPMLSALEQLSLAPEQLLLVGDSKNDLLSAQRADVDRAFVTYGYHQGINADDYSPQYRFDDFGQLQELFGL